MSARAQGIALWAAIAALALLGALTGSWWHLAGAIAAALIYRHWPNGSIWGVVLGAGVLVLALGITARNLAAGAPGWAVLALAGAVVAGIGLRRALVQYRAARAE